MKKKNILRTLIPFIALILVYAVFKILQPERFGSVNSIYLILQQSLMQCILGCGIYFLLSMGFFDFTIGVNTVMSAMIGIKLSNIMGWPGLILGTLIFGVVLAFCVGQMLMRIKANTMILSFGMVIILEAISSKLPGSLLSMPMPAQFRIIGQAPLNIIISVIVLVVSMLLYKYTKFGLYVRAIGSNRGIATNIGVDIPRYMTYTFIFCGVCAGIYGLVNTGYGSAVSAPSGMSSATSIFKPLMACMFASAYKKYLNPLLGVLVGVLLLNLIANGLLANGLEASLQNVVVGLALVVVVKLSSTAGKYEVVK